MYSVNKRGNSLGSLNFDFTMVFKPIVDEACYFLFYLLEFNELEESFRNKIECFFIVFGEFISLGSILVLTKFCNHGKIG